MSRKQEEAYGQRTDIHGAAPYPGPQTTATVPGYTYNTATIRGPVANSAPVYATPPVLQGRKSILDAYLLWFIFGLIGAHHFYLRRPGFGALYFFTFGLGGFGYLFDMFRVPYLVKIANKQLEDPSSKNKKNISDAYTLWFPFGLLGFHHFYLNNPGFGVLYVFTCGLFGIGWLVDLFRMPYMVRETNSRSREQMEKQTGTAYVLGMSPLGILGVHHFYLNRPFWGILYFLSFGICGLGWIIDWFRIAVLVKRANKDMAYGADGTRYLDDAYVLWLPFGILGAHHFYLNRPVWGILYFFTFGLCGVGWLVDGFRMPCLLVDCNKLNKERRRLVNYQCGHNGQAIATANTQGYNAPVYYPQQQLPQQQLPPMQQQVYMYQSQPQQENFVPSYMEQPPPYSPAGVPTSTGTEVGCEAKDVMV